MADYLCPSDLEPERLLAPATGPACSGALNLPYRPDSYRGVSGWSGGLGYIDSAEFVTYPREWRAPAHGGDQ